MRKINIFTKNIDVAHLFLQLLKASKNLNDFHDLRFLRFLMFFEKHRFLHQKINVVFNLH